LDEQLYPGYHVFKWNGKNAKGQRVSSGIYFYSLMWQNEIMETKKLIYFH
jgi:flagellar hook assembly protein FlgD